MCEFNNIHIHILQMQKRVGIFRQQWNVKINAIALLVLGILYLTLHLTFSGQNWSGIKLHSDRDNYYMAWFRKEPAVANPRCSQYSVMYIHIMRYRIITLDTRHNIIILLQYKLQYLNCVSIVIIDLFISWNTFWKLK